MTKTLKLSFAAATGAMSSIISQGRTTSVIEDVCRINGSATNQNSETLPKHRLLGSTKYWTGTKLVASATRPLYRAKQGKTDQPLS